MKFVSTYRKHQRVAILVTVASIGIFALIEPGSTFSLVLSASLIGLVGLPHGAFDIPIARRALASPLGPRWWAWFFSAYLTLSLLTLISFYFVPELSLVGFLVVSTLHFGIGDSRPHGARSGRVWEVFARGMIPVGVPAIFHTQRVGDLFAIIARNPNFGQSLAGWIESIAPFIIALGVIRMIPLDLRTFLELSSLVLLFAVAPPLVAFAIYFSVWHAARHWLEVRSSLEQDDSRRIFLLDVTPSTVAVLLAGAAAVGMLSLTVPFESSLIRVIFIGLAALTLPHILANMGLAKSSGSIEILPCRPLS